MRKAILTLVLLAFTACTDDVDECSREGDSVCIDEFTVKICVRGNSFDESPDDLHWASRPCSSFAGAPYCISENEKYLTCSFTQEKDALCPPPPSVSTAGTSGYCDDNVIQYCTFEYVYLRKACPAETPYCVKSISAREPSCSELSL